MIEYRSFLNTDPPALVEIWQNQKPFRCISAVLTRKTLDHMVLAKPYFDPHGLILAFDDQRPVGFVHVGFGPNAARDGVDHSLGILSQLRISDNPKHEQIGSGLIVQALDYLQRKGATECYAGSKFPFSPFYLGLYGGSRLPGVPAEDIVMSEALIRAGFNRGEKILVLQRNMQGYRPPVSRTQMAIRRQNQVTAIVDPLLPNWWECCNFGWAEIFGFRAIRRNDQQVVGSVMFWDIQPLSVQWGHSTMGLVDLKIPEEHRRTGLATFLVGESLRHLTEQGVSCVEVQIRESDEPALGLARRMGFEPISEGYEFEYSLPQPSAEQNSVEIA